MTVIRIEGARFVRGPPYARLAQSTISINQGYFGPSLQVAAPVLERLNLVD